MFSKILTGVANAATEFAENAVDAAGAMTSIVGSYTQGDEIQKEDVKKLIGAGFTMVEIASFFGVAEHVIREVLDEDEGMGNG